MLFAFWKIKNLVKSTKRILFKEKPFFYGYNMLRSLNTGEFKVKLLNLFKLNYPLNFDTPWLKIFNDSICNNKINIG